MNDKSEDMACYSILHITEKTLLFDPLGVFGVFCCLWKGYGKNREEGKEEKERKKKERERFVILN